MKELTFEEQIKVIKHIRKSLIKYRIRNIINYPIYFGLCEITRESFATLHFEHLYDYKDIRIAIPLFTVENAIKYANGSDENYWWSCHYPYDYKNRFKFLNWMIKTLKQQQKLIQK